LDPIPRVIFSTIKSQPFWRKTTMQQRFAMSRAWVAAWTLAALSLCGATEATTVFVHNGALNPVAAEGWTNYTGSGGATTAGALTNDLGSGFDAWSVDDNSTAFDTGLYYYEDLTTGQVAEGNSAGWRLSLRVRVANTPDGFAVINVGGVNYLWSAVAATYRDGSRDWYLGIASQADGDPIIRLPNSTSSLASTYALEGGGGGYHLYELVYDPVALSADFFIDGVETVSNILGNATSGGQRRVLWGAASSPDAGQGNYNLVRFATSMAPAVVPLPSAGLLVAGALGVLAGLRRRPM
jgi:large repetitive protein